MGHTKNPDFTQIFYDYGWMIGYDMQSAYDWSKIDEYDSGVTNRLDETIEEIARIASGDITEISLTHAKNLRIA